ncbi:phage tail tape measure protein [Streptomyces sp. NBC_00291]|uniref:phage tail tape measure protein n=1 Tax=Streptomyces sp. NBC_00291 TaxID=2975704 RepID=UPI0022541444|nr:phage tail tape measure protein [Streptomyces sp. NBC_00291]MCX5153701.1 phage tail tape measure protein [Streptomyces sp. NBC_00291]
MAKPITITLLGDESDLADSLERSTTDVTAFADKVEAALREATEEAAHLGDAVADGIDDAGDEVNSFGDRFGTAALLAGAAIAAGLAAGISEALDQDKGTDILAAQLGASPEQAKELGQAAGQVYAAGYGESVEEANDALRGLWREGLVPAGATADELTKVSKSAMDVATILGDEVGPVSKAAGQMLKTGLAKNAQEAFDILVVGAQNGANKAEDLADTFNEYSTQFRRVGLDGKTSLGLISQALQAGARDADQVADALGQFGERALAGGKPIEDAYKSIGLNADDVAAKLGKGGKSAEEALTMTLTALRGTKDETVQLNAAAALFGDPANVMGKALFAMDPATAAATNGLDKLEGATARAGETMHDNASTKLTAFWRGLQQGAVDVIGGQVIPRLEALATRFAPVADAAKAVLLDVVVPALRALKDGTEETFRFVENNKGVFIVVAGVITAILLPAIIAWGVTSIQAGIASATAWITSTATATTSAASQVLAHWSVVGGWLKAAGQAVVSAAVVVGSWIAMGAQALVQAARMAAAWVIAMGPIGLLIAAIVGLGLLIWANWDKIKQWTGEAWDWVWSKIKGTWDFLVALFMAATLVGFIVGHWDTIKNATGAAFDWVWSKIKGIWDTLVQLFLNFTGPGLLIKHWDTIKQATADAFMWVYTKARDGLNAVIDFFTGLPGRIAQTAGSVARSALGVGGSVVDGLSDGLSRLGGFASSLASSVSGAAKGAINSVVDLLNWAIPDRLGWGALSIDIPDSPIPHVRAMGGPSQGLTRVGERGPEWVSLPGGSTVIPNHAGPGGGGVVVNVRTNADPWAIGREVAWALKTA